MAPRYLVCFLMAAVFITIISGPPVLAGSSNAKASRISKEKPPPTGGCATGTTIDGVTTIPIRVVKSHSNAEPIVNVCIDGRGPFPLLLDTGAEVSVLSTELAEELGLDRSGSPRLVGGVGCTAKSQTFKLASWSVGGIELEGGSIMTLNTPEGGLGHTRGSLGADVLSRFGAARIDYKRQTLTLVGKEGARFGDSKAMSPSKDLLRRKPELSVPMKVRTIFGVHQYVMVKVAETGAEPWLVDTGASKSIVDSGIAKRAHLMATGTAERGHTYCSTVTISGFTAPSLHLPTGYLKPQTVGAFKGLLNEGIGGILGSYSLWQYGSVVVDWASGKLLLGAG